MTSRGAILGGVPLFQLLDDAGGWIALSLANRAYGSDAVVADG